MFSTNGTPKNEKHQASHSEQRTVALKGLSDRTTHKDIAAMVRGGALLDIFLRIRERVASVSFVDGAAAQEFLTHVKRHDLYILGKRVGIHRTKGMQQLTAMFLGRGFLGRAPVLPPSACWRQDLQRRLTQPCHTRCQPQHHRRHDPGGS